MSTYIATAEQARYNFKESYSLWHRKGASLDQPDGELAFQRLRKSLFTPSIRSGFKMRPDDKLFAIGSCFARGIEAALLARKIEVLSAAPEFASFQPVTQDVTALGFTNKYNTYSIYNELRWALDPEACFPKDSIVDVDNGNAYDPHTNPTLPLADLEETLRRRSIIQLVNARVAQCRVVIITLGLVEVWRDKIANTFTNTTPLPGALRNHPDRYEFHVSDFSQNFANLEHIHALLSQFGHPGFQVVVTVSPVPLMATFSTEDVVIANTYSKSTLRAVAQEWAAAYENVHYFPSYEIVLNSERTVTWEDDLRHVRGPIVQHIMRIFLEHYLE